MLLSAEIRWFWQREPRDLASWFRHAGAHGAAAGGGSVRTDQYLRDAGQAELGLKRRGGKGGVEVKGLVAILPALLDAPPFAGPIELWTKWTSEVLALEPEQTIAVEKQRWLRKYDTVGQHPDQIALDASEKPLGGRGLPTNGCNVELTRIRVSGEEWWSLGFEAFGSLDNVEKSLRAVAAMLATREPPALPAGLQAGYPAWLCERLAQG